MPRIIQVIESEVPRGKGVQDDPYRTVMQYHTPEGLLLAECDSWEERNRAQQACAKTEG